MRVVTVMLLSFLFGSRAGPAAELRLGDHTTLEFASEEQGRVLLGARDAFVERLSAFDRSSRLHTDRAVAEAEFLAHVTTSVVPWTDAERARVAAGWAELEPNLAALALSWPGTVLLIASNGSEEGGAAYTRGNAIVLAPNDRTKPPAEMSHLLAHELFHLLTRRTPELRDQLYAAIGFVRCGELDFPASLRERKITNPDAPELRHAIAITVDGQPAHAMPILFSRTERYDVARGGEFFEYLQLKLLLVEPGPVDGRSTPLADSTGPRLVEIPAAKGFFEQVGRNTRYIIHPEEILAENFALMLTGGGPAPSPEVVERLRRVLAAARQP